jgi:hypothetical protein
VFVQLCGLDQAHDFGRTLAGAQRAGEEPVRSSEGNWAYAVSHVIVVDGQIAE